MKICWIGRSVIALVLVLPAVVLAQEPAEPPAAQQPQQEQPEQVNAILLEFLNRN